ncbi:MAG: Hpt domain-containing protein, partial [Cyanobacteria bacterium P01_A01_bin.135]
MSSDQQQRIMGYFIEEAKDHLNTIEQGLLNLQGTIEDPDMISEVFRAAHSIKGGAAMLGIDSIQQMAHRLEDCFKSLKEQPVQVDQRLETLFLEVFDALKALIDQLQSPFGLTEKSAAKIVNTATPVLGELQQHLNQMLQSGVPTTRAAAGSKASASHDAERLPLSQPLLEAFRTEVPAQLRQMLQLFKQDDTASGRAQLDDCCQLLLLPGESVDLPAAWDRLVDQVRSAIAYPDNSYRQLAPVVITNLKQAQEQVLAAQGHAITPSSALDALTPSQPGSSLDDLLADFSDPFDAAAEEVALPAETDALAAEAALEGSDDADLLTDLGTFAQDTEETDDELADLFELDAPAAESASQPQAEQARLDLVSALSDTADSDLDSLFGDLMDEDANLDGGEHELSAVELPVPGQDEPSQTELGQTELGQAEPSQVEPQQDSSDGLQEALPAELRDTGLDDLDIDDLGDLFSQAEDGLASTEPPALFSSPGEPGTPSASDAELEAPDDEANLAELDALFDDEPSTEAEDFSLFDEPSDAQLPQPTGEEPSGAALEPELNLDGQSADQEGSSATDLDAIDRDITDNTEPAADLSDLNLDDLDQELPEDLGFDVAAVDVTEDVWSEGDESWLDAIAEADPAPLTAAGAGGDAAPEAALPEEDALDEPLDSLFEALGDPPDIFATPDVEPGDGLSGVEGISVEEGDTGEISAEAIGFEESGPEAISAGEVGAEALDLEGPSDDDAESPFPELPAEEVVSEPPENSATPSPGPATQPFDDSILEDEPPLNALFSDFLGTDSEEAAANPDPFSLDDLVGDLHPDGDQPSQVTLDATPDPTAEQEDAAEISSAGETQLENWDEAPPSPEATGDEEALPGASEFDDLLSIGSRDLEDDSSDLADADVTDPIAALDAQQDPLSDLPDIGGGLQSSEPAFRSDSMADAFSDLDSLLGDTDAAVQADLLGDLESLEG